MIITAETRAPVVAIQEYGDDFIEHLKNLLSKRMAEGVLDILAREPSIAIVKQTLRILSDMGRDEETYRVSLEWKPLVQCKDCKYRPGNGMFFSKCPCGIYYVREDFYCANGEREEKTDDGNNDISKDS